MERATADADEPLVSGRSGPSQFRQMAITFVYCGTMALNGGTVGAFGPSLETFERNTKLPQVAIGSAVLVHRLAKVFGNIVWGWYASLLQRRREQGVRLALSPHVLMSGCLLLTGICSVLLGITHSQRTFQAAMGVAGFCYGVTDSACNLMILWAWQHDARRQRVYVALLNAMFTSGAFITPMLVAGTLHYMHGVVWPAFHALAIFGAVQAVLLPLLPPPPVPYRGSSELEGEDAGHELEALHPTPSAVDTPDPPSTLPSPSLGPKRDVPPPPLAGDSGRGCGELDEATPGKAKAPPAVAGVRVQGAMMAAVCVLCFVCNGCEHAVATWLAPYGVDRLKLNEERMAIMTSNFWTTMSMGRILWACFSGQIESAWPVIFVMSFMCLGSGFCLLSQSEPVLWCGALLVGGGVSAAFPAAVTLPPEMGVQMSPQMMTVLCLFASCGEMLFPFIVAIFFQHDMYAWFGGLTLLSQSVNCAVLLVTWSMLTGRLRCWGGFAAAGYH